MNKGDANKIIVRPLVTEKTLGLVEKENQYTFQVSDKANKIEVQKAIEALFDVKVLKVRIVNTLGKRVNFGKRRISGLKSNYKKAFVTLKVGDKISVFEIK